jgi:hypothetical protein
MAMIQARVTDEEAEQFRSFAEAQGISMSDLIRTSLNRHIEKRKRAMVLGCLKDKLRIADDFMDPLDDFAEYME